jgi:hypothetical protein
MRQAHEKAALVCECLAAVPIVKIGTQPRPSRSWFESNPRWGEVQRELRSNQVTAKQELARPRSKTSYFSVLGAQSSMILAIQDGRSPPLISRRVRDLSGRSASSPHSRNPPLSESQGFLRAKLGPIDPQPDRRSPRRPGRGKPLDFVVPLLRNQLLMVPARTSACSAGHILKQSVPSALSGRFRIHCWRITFLQTPSFV